MQLFLSTYKNKVDKKLRVSVPAQFRSVLSKSTFNGVIIYKSIVNNCLEGCSMEKIENTMEKINNLDPFSNEKDIFMTAILGNSHQAAFDTEGRIVLPHELVEDLKISDLAVFIGKGDTFEIWNSNEFDQYIKNVRQIANENREKLKNLSKA